MFREWIKRKNHQSRLKSGRNLKDMNLEGHIISAIRNIWSVFYWCFEAYLFQKYKSLSSISAYVQYAYNTGRFIMFSVITNIYNKKTKGPTLMELFTATGTQKTVFWQLEMLDVCTTVDAAHIDTIFKCLPHTRQHGCINILHCCNDPCLYNIVSMCAVSPAVHTSNFSSCQKKLFQCSCDCEQFH
jgi:hypothetical protein